MFAEAWRQSPVAYGSTTQAPLFIVCGADETAEFIRQSQLMWEAWPDNRRPLDGPLFVAGANHFTIQFDHARADSELTLGTLALF